MAESAAQASRKSKRLESRKFYLQSRSATVAINPPSDILLDVATAAHPAKLRTATQRLEETGSEKPGAAFTTTLEAMEGAKAAEPAAARTAGPQHGRTAALLPRDSEAKALEKFEAFFLQNAVEAMMPKNAETVFGSGTAGDIWRSMLAEQIAAEIARGMKFGIAEQLAGGHFRAGMRQSTAQLNPVLSGGDTARTGNNLPYLKDQPRPPTLSTDPGRPTTAQSTRS
jgi:flagellar protein FlgJ